MNFTKFYWIVILCLSAVSLIAQTDISGIVKDASTQESLPFATISYSKSKGTISNEDGRFTIRTDEEIKRIQVSYIGYQTKEIVVNAEKEFIILLEQSTNLLHTIVVKARDDLAYNILLKSSNKSWKKMKKKQMAKAFSRTYSYKNENDPTELLEAFYNVDMSNAAIDQFTLKNGRFGIPKDSYLINFHMTDLFTAYGLYNKTDAILPLSPLVCTSIKEMKKLYDARIISKYPEEKDTVYQISFQPVNPGKYFGGFAYVRQSNMVIEKLSFEIDNSKLIPFETVVSPEDNPVARLDIKLDIGFKYHNEHPVFDFIYAQFKSTINQWGAPYVLTSNTKIVFYDYDQMYNLPFFSIAKIYNDYEKVVATPYNKSFWKRNFTLGETSQEKAFRQELEKKKLFVNYEGNSRISLLRNRFEFWTDEWTVDTARISNRANFNGGDNDRVVYINQDPIPTDDNLFAEVFIFLDYDCYQDRNIFTTGAIMDYRFSYTIFRKPIDFDYLEVYLLIAKMEAEALKQHLQQKYSTHCPTRKEIEKEKKIFDKRLEKASEKYFKQAHKKRSPKKLKELTKTLVKTF